MRYFDDKAVDPPKRRTRGKGRVIKVRDDRKDTTSDPACDCSFGGITGYAIFADMVEVATSTIAGMTDLGMKVLEND